MTIWELLTTHRHYWGIVHPRPSDGKPIQTCYGCSKERVVLVELRTDDLMARDSAGIG